jgi:hypothetical protein
MMTIILSACLVADPGQCKDFRLPLDGDWDTRSCAMSAPPYFAKWMDEHPAWRVMRWKCQPSSLNDT